MEVSVAGYIAEFGEEETRIFLGLDSETEMETSRIVNHLSAAIAMVTDYHKVAGLAVPEDDHIALHILTIARHGLSARAGATTEDIQIRFNGVLAYLKSLHQPVQRQTFVCYQTAPRRGW